MAVRPGSRGSETKVAEYESASINVPSSRHIICTTIAVDPHSVAHVRHHRRHWRRHPCASLERCVGLLRSLRRCRERGAERIPAAHRALRCYAAAKNSQEGAGWCEEPLGRLRTPLQGLAAGAERAAPRVVSAPAEPEELALQASLLADPLKIVLTNHWACAHRRH